MTQQHSTVDPVRHLPPLRHWGGFLISGLIALASDASLLQFGILILGLSPLVARILAISGAMIAGWLAHRRLTFSLSTSPTLVEFARYSATAWAAAAINYATFAAVLFFSPATHPLIALVLASILATFFAYTGMRYRVFRGKHDRLLMRRGGQSKKVQKGRKKQNSQPEEQKR